MAVPGAGRAEGFAVPCLQEDGGAALSTALWGAAGPTLAFALSMSVLCAAGQGLQQSCTLPVLAGGEAGGSV